MLTLVPSPAAFIRIRSRGRLGAEDYRRFEPEFAAELQRRNLPISLLLDIRGFKGWTPAGLLRDLRWDLRNRLAFSKIAVIGDARWHRWITAVAAPLFSGPLTFFRANEESRAEDWLG